MRLSSRNYRYQNKLNQQFDRACVRPEPTDFEYLTTVNGQKVIMTDHALSRSRQRDGFTRDQLKDLFKRASNRVLTVQENVSEYNQEVFIYSTHYQRGVVVAFRRDYKNQGSGALCMVVVTVYPYGQVVPMQKDTEVFYV